MNFAAFQSFRENLLRGRPEILDAAETNLYRVLAPLIPPPAPLPEAKVHRCHLASQWVELFGFAPELSRSALISCGVRDSLAILFDCLAKSAGARLWLPEDNYPVYGDLARAAGLTPLTFPTLPEPVWPQETRAAAAPPEWLLITNPLKPANRFLTSDDVTALRAWLSVSPQRRLLIDAVYTFGTRFHATTLDLLATGQTLLLHSLTKGWLHPRLFGITLVPPQDAPELTAAFRDRPPSQHSLARARELMDAHRAMPQAVQDALVIAGNRLRAALPATISLPHLTDAAGYFIPVQAHWRDLLETHGILGLPASVFGSPRAELTLLSSLSLCP